MKGLRSLADVRLRLDGLTVLIGDNGSGKSSLIEACELLQRAASESFSEDLNRIHGGVGSLLRAGAEHLELGLVLEPDDRRYSRFEYAFTLDTSGVILRERLDGVAAERDDSNAVVERRIRVISREGGLHRSSSFRFLTEEPAPSPVGVWPTTPAKTASRSEESSTAGR